MSAPVPAPWATAEGRDAYGPWAEVMVAGVALRMRWVPPGRFVMGSPEGEEGRDADEGSQHTVVLTQGLWLGETPVTQAVWEAVMGDNPSRFQGGARPVEQVSWDECQEFVKQVNKKVAGLDLRLQREHACRAGTTAATWAGALEILGENNAPVLDGIAWYGGNRGGGTHPGLPRRRPRCSAGPGVVGAWSGRRAGWRAVGRRGGNGIDAARGAVLDAASARVRPRPFCR